MTERIQTPWAVRVFLGGLTSSSNGWTKRYFETREQAIRFAQGNSKLALYRPGEAWIHAPAPVKTHECLCEPQHCGGFGPCDYGVPTKVRAAQ